MNFRPLLCALAVVATGCTFSEQQNTVKADFHPPLVAQQWKAEQYTLKIGAQACTVTSGYNAIAVDLVKRSWGVDTEVESTRLMQPGMTFTVIAGGERFTTGDTFFQQDQAPKIVEALLKGGTAYLEWSEFHGPVQGSGRLNVQNVVQLDEFPSLLQQCRASLK